MSEVAETVADAGVTVLEHWRRRIATARDVLWTEGPQSAIAKARAARDRHPRPPHHVTAGDKGQAPTFWDGVDSKDLLAVDPSRPFRPRPRTEGVPRIGWVVPPASPGAGGHGTIFRAVRGLRDAGMDAGVLLYAPRPRRSFEEYRAVIREGWPDLDAPVLPYSSQVAETCDALVATAWETAYPVRAARRPSRRFYFVQDFEPWFFAVGSHSAMAENTYRLGLTGITAGPWLADKLSGEFGMTCTPFPFGADLDVYRATTDWRERNGVVFYARPSTPRRGFEVGVLALNMLHRADPSIRIHIVGASLHDQHLGFPYTDHGVLSARGLNEVFNQCRAGLVLSLTNASLSPLEMLAAGTTPVVNDGPNNRMVLSHPSIRWAPVEPRALARGLLHAEPPSDAGRPGPPGWDEAVRVIVDAVRRGLS